MSRIGRQPIAIPQGVKLTLEGHAIRVQGPKGTLAGPIPANIEIEVDGNQIKVARKTDERNIRALHGLTRRLVANMVVGVSQGFSRVLEINGVGYRAEVKGNALNLNLGYSRPVVFPLPDGIAATVDRQTVITLQGADRQLLGETAAKLRRLKMPEPYKGKGIKYAEEVIRRKAGKAVGGTTTG